MYKTCVMMFIFLLPSISLEVIPGDAYRVERTGDEQKGYVSKVVFTKKQKEQLGEDDDDDDDKGGRKEDRELKEKDEKCSTNTKSNSNVSNNGDSERLTKKERQKLKRKAKREQAKERKRLKKESQPTPSNDAPKSSPSLTMAQTTDKAAEEQIQTTWSISAQGVTLHSTLCRGLHLLNYTYPTPIQSATLPAAILGRRDIVGAAPTGSGKTLSYGLPILQWLLESGGAVNDSQNNQQTQSKQKQLPLQALILTPTRELALQVTDELKKVSCKAISIGTIVGGFAEVKQKRMLDKVRPQIVVATPGRLWELVSCSVSSVALF